MSSKKKVFQNSVLYIFSSLLVKSIGFLLLPIYTYYLTPEDYGITNMIASFTSATFIVAFSLYSAVIRFDVDYKDDREKLKRFFGTIITFVFISSLIFFFIALLLRDVVINLFFKGISFFPFVFISFSSLIFISLHTIHQNILKGMQKGKKLTITNLIFFFFQVTLTLILIGVLKLGALGVLLSSLIINVLYFFFLFFDLYKNDLIKIGIDFPLLKESLKYSIPILPHNLSTNIAQFASRVFINKNDSLANVGLYSVSNQFGSIIDIIQSSVNQAFQPWFFENMKNDKNLNKIGIISLSSFLLIIYTIIYMAIGLFSQEVILLITPSSYALAWTVIPILVVGFSAKSIYYFYVNILFYYKSAVRLLFTATITGSIVDIIIAYLLVPKYGMYGAALAFTLAKIVIVFIVVVISRKYNDIGYRVIDMIKIILPSLVFMAIGLFFSYYKYVTFFNWKNLVYKCIVFLLYMIYIYFTNKKSIMIAVDSLKQIFNKKKNRRNKIDDFKDETYYKEY